ncbi:MAG: AAA family ATPase [Sphingomonadales bacterium]|jgi:general secretion pathway protein A|nr:AAA family ATPase [Sphingomonadales bacterium]MBK9004229.1 AAA family ATPase [Sphingomonadales bacterium]MBK9269406.1 AAA family ATPase [Sphingomonadales bacterium]MBP6434291.1 XrtA-associated ATPase [Sphingorhabdus sp.]
MYDHYYGLSGRPFQLTPDPHYYFESGTHRKALSYLGYGLAQGEGFIVITGEVGSGKSTLVSHLMQTIDKARLTAATIVTSQLDAVDLVQMTAESFGIDTRGLDKAAALKAIENFLHAEARAGRRCLLVVDEAQNLTVDALEELRMLSNFQLGSTALLQIFLLGQPEFRNLLQTAPELEQLRQRVIATHHLEAMDADEVQPYIEHRLARAGWNGRPQLTADAYDALYNETGGVPRKLNAVMNRCLLMGAVEQTDTIDGALVVAVIADMTGKPFEYDATLASQAPIAKAASAPVAAKAQAVAVDSARYQALASRIDQLEARMATQDVTMRRVLAMLIDWMEKENQSLAARMRDMRAA